MNLIDIAELKQDQNNARVHTKQNLDMIEQSLDEVGAGRSILIDEDNNILAGNGTAKVAAKKGMKVVVVETDANTIVAVKRTDLTARQKTRAALLDNRAAELAKWDKKVLNRLAQEAPEQMLLGGVFEQDMLDKILKEQADAQPLAMGGAEEPDAELAAAAATPVEQTAPPSSQVRMVQLMLTLETQPEFIFKVRALGKLYGTTTITDTVLECVRRGWDVLPKETAAADAAAATA